MQFENGSDGAPRAGSHIDRRAKESFVPPITLRELELLMRQYVWDGDWQSFEHAPDQPFDELGYDSLALLETHSRIKRDYGVLISEDDLERVHTPRALVDFINDHLGS